MTALLLMLTALLLSGCAGVPVERYADNRPALVLEDYFAGQTTAWGIFQDGGGEVIRRFRVDIDGRMENGTLVLDESFQYADGETDRRVWRIERLDEHRYRGQAGDIIGTATGVRHGNALNWRYTLALETGDGTWQLDFNDWMYLLEDGVLINRAEVTKWGFRVGEVTLFFKKED
ncbi:DUF3833 domain-containing protein [Ectothiorhodospiraceae bacterium WFHF3C12]|nr:DUF3833 domain-containing protein [Ectothiorhodospiraceae bacterium WFHF3C12]